MGQIGQRARSPAHLRFAVPARQPGPCATLSPRARLHRCARAASDSTLRVCQQHVSVFRAANPTLCVNLGETACCFLSDQVDEMGLCRLSTGLFLASDWLQLLLPSGRSTGCDGCQTSKRWCHATSLVGIRLGSASWMVLRYFFMSGYFCPIFFSRDAGHAPWRCKSMWFQRPLIPVSRGKQRIRTLH